MSKPEIAVFALAAALAMAAIVLGSVTSNAAVAGALAVLSPVAVIAYQSVQTRRAVEASTSEADASRQLVQETRNDREFAVRPFLALGDRSYSAPDVKGFALRNVGRGSASQIRVLYRDASVGAVFWNGGGSGYFLASGDELAGSPDDAGPGRPALLLTNQSSASGVRSYIVDGSAPNDLAAYCLDQLGNWLRFNLRTGEPPEVWRPGESPPEWADFRQYR